jgi:hypothetical protein
MVAKDCFVRLYTKVIARPILNQDSTISLYRPGQSEDHANRVRLSAIATNPASLLTPFLRPWLLAVLCLFAFCLHSLHLCHLTTPRLRAMQKSAPSMSQQVGLQSAMELPKDASYESNLSPAQRSETIASVQDNNGHERPRKASLVSRVKSAVKNRENVKLAACYYALATAVRLSHPSSVPHLN